MHSRLLCLLLVTGPAALESVCEKDTGVGGTVEREACASVLGSQACTSHG